MAREDLDASSKLCREVGKEFIVSRFPSSSYQVFCAGCDRRAYPWNPSKRSEFVTLVAHCPDGHTEWRKQSAVDLCATCIDSFVFNVTSRQQACSAEGCGRMLEVDEEAVKRRLKRNVTLLKNYLSYLELNRKFECIYCLQMHTFRKAAVLRATGCTHDLKVCRSELKRKIEAAINDSQLDDLKCPDLECGAMIAPEDIRDYVTPELFERFNERKSLNVIANDPKFRWCQGKPNGKPCGNGQIHVQGSEMPIWFCEECRSVNCFNCHPSPCRVHAMSNSLPAEEADSTTLINAISKVCPRRGCGRRLMRAGGCAHMTCEVIAGNGCGTQFCWTCKVIWPDGRPAHLEHCRWRLSDPVDKPSSFDPLYEPGWDEDPGYDTANDEAIFMPMFLR